MAKPDERTKAIDDVTWEALSCEPLYPCAKCSRVKFPRRCHNKECDDWRQWIMRDWLVMQYNAGIITEEEYNERMKRVNEQC